MLETALPWSKGVHPSGSVSRGRKNEGDSPSSHSPAWAWAISVVFSSGQGLGSYHSDLLDPG